jgi:hypothetical protein
LYNLGDRVQVNEDFTKNYNMFEFDTIIDGVVLGSIQKNKYYILTEKNRILEIESTYIIGDSPLIEGAKVRTAHEQNMFYYGSRLQLPEQIIDTLAKPKKPFYGVITKVNDDLTVTVKTKTGREITIASYWLIPYIQFVPFGEEKRIKDHTKAIEVDFPFGKDTIYVDRFKGETYYIRYPHPYYPTPVPPHYEQELDAFINVEVWTASHTKGFRKYKNQIKQAVDLYKKYEQEHMNK